MDNAPASDAKTHRHQVNMDHHELGVAVLDLQAIRRHNEGKSSGRLQHDSRSILYSSEIRSKHRIVRVQLQQSKSTFAFAELRPSADGTVTTASIELLDALGLQLPVDGSTSGQLVNVVLSTDDSHVERAKCQCETGVVDQLSVRFHSRRRPPRAVLEGMTRVIRSLLLDAQVWANRPSRVTWFNTVDTIEFEDVKCTQAGSGCCESLCKIVGNSRINLTFADDRVGNPRNASLNTVEEYVERVDAALGGVARHAKPIIAAMRARLSGDSSQNDTSVGAILNGLPGVGKTVLARTICESMGVHVQYLNGPDIFQTFVGHSEAKLVKLFEDITQRAPSVFVIDGLESVAATRARFHDSESTLEVGVLGTFLACLSKVKSANSRVFVLGTTSLLEDVDPAVYSNGRMDLVIQVDPPSQTERAEILQRMTKEWVMEQCKSDVLAKLSDSTGGFVAADLLSLCQKALQVCLNQRSAIESQPVVRLEHFDEALRTTYPSVLQTHHVSLRGQESARSSHQSSQSPFGGIYGVDDALKTIVVSLLEPMQDLSRFTKFGAAPPKGILVTGPPGSGKTHLANVVGAEVRHRGLASFVSVKCTDLLTKVVGDTEKSLRELFETARSAAPCVLFFDQIESIAPIRGFDTSTEQTFDRLLSMLLVEMDGFNTSRDTAKVGLDGEQAREAFMKQHIVILASTNDKQNLDPAILRPGRFDVHIELQLPDVHARELILLDALQQIPIDYTSDDELNTPAKIASYIAQHTQYFTAGDLSSLLREAAMAAMREHLESTTVSIRFIHEALASHRRSKERYQN